MASQAQQFTPGNLVVLRVGDGSATLNNASTLTFLDEYSPAGSPVGSTPFNASDSGNRLTNTGNGTSEGMLTLSTNGQYLVTTGYNSAAGVANISSSTAASTPRTVARIGTSKAIDITTALPDAYSGGNIRGAASVDGSTFLLSGSTGGIRTAARGATTSSSISTTIASTRVVHIYRGQTYFSTAAGTTPGIYVVGAATKSTAGQVATAFITTGSGTNSASPYGFVLLDRDPNIPGPDAAYIADDGGGGTAAGGIQKWSFDGTAWTLQSTATPAARGLTGTLNPDNSVTLYLTTRTSLGGNALATLTDTNTNTLPFSTSTATVIATAVSNAAFRGVDFTPGTLVALPVQLTSFAATRVAAGIQLRWATASELNSRHFEVQRSADGHAFMTIAQKPARGTTAQPSTYSALDQDAPASLRYYRLKQVDQDGTSAYSPTVAVGAGAGPELSISPNPAAESISFSTEAPATYAVRTALGRGLLQGTTLAGTTVVAVASLPAGVYFLEVQTVAGRLVRRFSKN